jgi:hypothetical protein
MFGVAVICDIVGFAAAEHVVESACPMTHGSGVVTAMKSMSEGRVGSDDSLSAVIWNWRRTDWAGLVSRGILAVPKTFHSPALSPFPVT